MSVAVSRYSRPGTHHSFCRDGRIPLGRSGEAEAVRYLRRRSYEIIETNFRTRYGEIDIIARHGEVVAFVEVKTRHGAAFGRPFEAVGPRKQEQLRRMALSWVARRQGDPAFALCAFRFDVISITVDASGRPLEIVHLEDAFR